MQMVESVANSALLPIQRSSGVLVSTAVKLLMIGSRGMRVGGQARISCGVLKAFEIRNSNGSSISTQNSSSARSIARFSALKGRRGAADSATSGRASASVGTTLIWHLARVAGRTAPG